MGFKSTQQNIMHKVYKNKRLSNEKVCSYVDMDKKLMVRTLVTLKQWEFLTKIISDKPDCASIYVEIDDRGHVIPRLPLHEVCRHKPSLKLIKSLVSAYPKALSIKDSHNGSTPLHFACRYGASERVFNYLLKKYPDSAIIEDKYGCSPAVLAKRSSYKHRDDVIKLFDDLCLVNKLESRISRNSRGSTSALNFKLI